MVRKLRQPGQRVRHRRGAQWQKAIQRRSWAEPLEARVVMAANPIISEFQADNQTTLRDKDGAYSDWIEIRNPGTEPINLQGWSLTDLKSDLRQWTFPSRTLGAGEYLVVFASGKNLKPAEGELHTNFALRAGGEYLALVKPDGITVSQAFDPYPAQLPDQSYGLASFREVTNVITDDAPIKAFVPIDDSLGSTWTAAGFNDASWLSGSTAVGYEQLLPGTTEREDFNAALGSAWTVSIPPGGTGTATVTGGALQLTVPTGQDTTAANRGTAPIVYRNLLTGSQYPDSYVPVSYEIITQINKDSASNGNAGLMIYSGSTDKPVIRLEYVTETAFRLFAQDVQVATRSSSGRDNFGLRLVRDGVAKTWTGYYRLDAAATWTLVGTFNDGEHGVPVITEPKAGLFARTPTGTMNARFDYMEVIAADQPPVYGPEIKLNVDQAMRLTNSSIFMRMPFTVTGDPQRFDELILTTRYDDGFRAYLNGTEVTAQNVPVDATSGERWSSYASGAFGAVGNFIPVQQLDLSAHVDLLQTGTNVLAIHGMNDVLLADLPTDPPRNDPDFFFDATLAANRILSQSNQAFTRPTPGATNEMPVAPAPRIVGRDGMFFGTTTFELAMEDPTLPLVIRYTVDGSTPTETSTLYTGPVTLTQSARLQTRAFDNSGQGKFLPGNIGSGTFIAMDAGLRNFSSDIPVMVLDTLGQALPGTSATTLVGMNVALVDVSKATGRAALDGGIINYLGRGGARDRGSSTAGQPKPNMTFETWGKTGTMQDNDENASLLGLASDSDWILHAPYTFDRNLLRNPLAFDLSNEMDMWATNWRFVEVYLNRGRDAIVSSADYAGVYMLMEKVDQGGNRVDITEITTTDNQAPNISGGYIWKVDRDDPDAGGFTAGGQTMQWVYPKSPNSRTARPDQKATPQQQQWVVDYFNAFRNTLRTPNINDENGYSKYIDPAVWVDHHLLNVYMMNVDALRLSAYFFKDRDSRVEYGPVFDFDRSAESDDSRDDDPYVWRSEVPDYGTDFFGNGTQQWWGDLFKDPGFWQLYVDRWQEWRRTTLSDAHVDEVIDRIGAQLGSGEALARNFAKWTGTRPRSSSGFNSGLLNGTWQGEVENMRQWLKERAAFMDSNFVQPVRYKLNGQELGDVPGAYVNSGQQVEIASPPLVYYNDTKLVSGEVGVTTARYLVPVDDTLGTNWTSRTFNDSSWSSGPTGLGFDTGTDFTNVLRTTVNPNAVKEGATTVLSRLPFQISNLQQALSRDLILRMKYDDGFVAYLNGKEVLRHNLRDADLTWTSRANSRTAPTDREMAANFQDFDLSEFRNLLVQGNNVLAIRGINRTNTDSDLLVLPELVSRETIYGVNPAAKVYYTTDGTDPRGVDGNPSATARLLPAGQKVTITENTRVIARNFDNITDRGAQSRVVGVDDIFWSGPVQYDFVVTTAPLVISEINYNPADPTPAELAVIATLQNGDFEFIEIHNQGTTAANLVGVQLTDGVDFDFFHATSRTLPAGGHTVVVRNKEAFQLRYGNQIAIAGVFDGNLDNTGEDVDLKDGAGTTIFSTMYSDSDPWAVRADGSGGTIELVNPSAPLLPAVQSKWYSWRGSREFGGSPGRAGAGPLGVVINEVLAATRGINGARDAIELLNTSSQPVNISGWYLSDSDEDFLKFKIPANTVLQPGQYVVYDERQFNPGTPGSKSFGLNQDSGDSVWLVMPNAQNNGITSFVDDVHFGATMSGESLGRMPNGSGRLAPLSRLTFGATNGTPRVGPLVITEIQYNPTISPAALAAYPEVDESDLEFVEIHNPTGQLFDLTNWRLRAGADYDFPADTTLAAGESILVLKFKPSDPENIHELNAFKAQYGVGNTVRMLGGYEGRLNNADDRITLLRPGTPPLDEPNYIPRFQEDEVLYDDRAPWPMGADGTGNSLQRKTAGAFGNDPASWFSGLPSPGRLLTSIPGDYNRDGRVNAVDINLLFVQLRSPTPNLSYDLTNDGKVNVADRDQLIVGVIGTTYGDANLDLIFDSADFVLAFQSGEYEDAAAVNSGWEEGDWNGDGEFNSNDFILAFAFGGYEVVRAAPQRQLAAQPILVGAALAPLGEPGEGTTRSAATPAQDPAAAAPAVIRPEQIVDGAIESLFADEPEILGDDPSSVQELDLALLQLVE